MKHVRAAMNFMVFMTFTLVLSACGSSDSSSGAGGGELRGRYSGTWTATLSGAGQTLPGNGTMTILINPDGSVVVDPESQNPGSGTLTGNNINVNWPVSTLNQPGVTCTGDGLSLVGTAANNSITGSIGPDSFTCNGVAFNVRGNFNVSKTARAPIKEIYMPEMIGKLIDGTLP